MKPAIDPKNVAALMNYSLPPRLLQQDTQLTREEMDAEVIPLLESHLFTFGTFEFLDSDWKPSNEFERWVDTKLFIRCDVPIMMLGYVVTLHYANGYLASATVKVGDYSFRYQQKEMGWTNTAIQY